MGGRNQPRSRTVPLRYHSPVAMNLRLDDDEAVRLKRAAAKAGLSMQQAARIAIHEWVARAEGLTMGQLMARPPLGGGRISPGTAAKLLHEARLEAGRE
jgi:hypothetical protein